MALDQAEALLDVVLNALVHQLLHLLLGNHGRLAARSHLGAPLKAAFRVLGLVAGKVRLERRSTLSFVWAELGGSLLYLQLWDGTLATQIKGLWSQLLLAYFSLLQALLAYLLQSLVRVQCILRILP